MRLDLEVFGAEKSQAHLDKLEERAGNIRPVLEQGGSIIARGVAKNFATGGGHLGGKGSPWPALAYATLERKRREGRNNGVLIADGDLKSAMETGLSGGGSFRGTNFIFKVAGTQVRVGTSDHRARFHQGGVSHDSGKRSGRTSSNTGMPARKLVGIASRDRQQIYRQIRRHFIVE